MNDKGVCRTAPATPSLFNIITVYGCNSTQVHKYNLTGVQWVVC